ncbi:MAG: GNAT family N-acetyltransferase [Betaproteobacteria bacterium]|nr:GNAT family N-acetyltransferase [Betaproteobacteria bacterium]
MTATDDLLKLTAPVELSAHGVLLRPLELQDEAGLARAAADGQLWELRVTSVPAPGQTQSYIETALRLREQGSRLAFVVIEQTIGQIIGCSSYHDILPEVRRVEIGYTWYAKSWQRTHVNTTCKWLLMRHAFETLQCPVVGWRTDCLNFASQAAIERLGARKDGVIRRNAMRRDGTIRDTVMYSLTRDEWPAVQQRLLERLERGARSEQTC